MINTSTHVAQKVLNFSCTRQPPLWVVPHDFHFCNSYQTKFEAVSGTDISKNTILTLQSRSVYKKLMIYSSKQAWNQLPDMSTFRKRNDYQGERTPDKERQPHCLNHLQFSLSYLDLSDRVTLLKSHPHSLFVCTPHFSPTLYFFLWLLEHIFFFFSFSFFMTRRL